MFGSRTVSSMNDDAPIFLKRRSNSAPSAIIWHIVYGIQMMHDWYTESIMVEANRWGYKRPWNYTHSSL